MRRAPVAITGVGAVTAFGAGVDLLRRALAEGADAIRPIERFSTEGFSVRTAAMVPPGPQTATLKTADLALAFAVTAAAEALREAHLPDVPPERIAVTFGTSLATHPRGIHHLAELLGDSVGARGPRLTLSTACSSSANAVGLGRDLLLAGLADVVIAGGADALTEEIFAGFHNLGLLAPSKCAPFSEPPGTTLGEGAGFLVLERGEEASRRAAPLLGWVSGHGLSCDAHHATSPDPTGAGVARAARAALADAGITPADIDYVNAHGTGTEANDPAEWAGILAALGERARSVPVSSTKSLFGHGQGAAGVLELIATLLAMRHGAVPQTLHHTRPRPRCPEDPVAQRTPRLHPVRHALCNSSAFGGANAIVALDSPAHPSPSRPVARRTLRVLGAGLSLPGPAGTLDLAALAALGNPATLTSPDAHSPYSGSPPLFGRLPPGPAPRSLAGVDLRGFDPLSRFLTFATAEALRDAGLSARSGPRDRTGLFAALARISPTSAHELDASVKERGLLRLSAPAFTRVVLNASTGACARALQLRGPTTTLTTGHGSGLTALVLAAEHLSLRDDADLLCVAAADEIDRDESPAHLTEAGVCLVLAAADAPSFANSHSSANNHSSANSHSSANAPTTANPLSTPSPRSPVVLAGWGLAGPGERALATRRALAMAGVDPSAAPPPTFDCGSRFEAPAAHPLLHAAVAIHRLRAGHGATLLLTHDGPSVATAVLLASENAS